MPEQQVLTLKKNFESIKSEMGKTTFDEEYQLRGKFLKRRDKYPYSLLSKAEIMDLGINSIKL